MADAAEASVVKIPYALEMYGCVAFERMVDIDFPCIMDNDIHGRSQLMVSSRGFTTGRSVGRSRVNLSAREAILAIPDRLGSLLFPRAKLWESSRSKIKLDKSRIVGLFYIVWAESCGVLEVARPLFNGLANSALLRGQDPGHRDPRFLRDLV